MLRRVFLADIDDGHWGLIKDLHENAKSVIKWEGNISQPRSPTINFLICTKQWGILSTNLCKLYINQLFNMYETMGYT